MYGYPDMEEKFLNRLTDYLKESKERHYDSFIFERDIKKLVHDFYYELDQEIEEDYADLYNSKLEEDRYSY